MNEKLLPCPFCGEAAYFERYGTHRQSCIVACQHCGCSLETGEIGNHCGGMWNARAAQPAIPEGWKLVPAEPTERQQDVVSQFFRYEDAARVAYKTMLEAAPEPPCST